MPKEYFALIYQDTLQPVMVLDQQLEIQYCNAGFYDLCAAMGLDAERFLAPLAQEAAKGCMERLCGDSLVVSGAFGELSVALIPCLYQDQKYLSLLPSRKAESLQAEEKKRILRNADDRLRKYLNEIYATAQKLEEKDRERQIITEGVRRILRLSNHLYQSLDREATLDYRVPMNIGSFAEGYAMQFNRLSEKKVRFSALEDGLYARIMPEDTELILGTLLSNAARFGGEDILLQLEKREKELILSVWDSGEGASEPDRLFEWGFRTPDKKGRKGLGFSLPMAKKLAERQGAILRYQPKDSGCAFELVLQAEEQLKGAILAEWKPEEMENSLSQLRVELSDL